MLVLTACTSTTNDKNTATDPFIGGNSAITLFLQNGAPPPTIYDGGKAPFGVNIVLQNIGEADIGPGTDNPYVTAHLEGILPENFGITDADLHLVLNERINGAHKNFDGTILGGQVTNLIFDQLNYQGKLEGDGTVTLRGVVCYDYSNMATAQLCMKSEMLENVQDSTICTLTGERVVSNSGGPIHITHMTQNPLGNNKIMLTFDVEHVGPGEFYGRSSTEDCDPSVRNMDKYIVDLNVSVQDPESKVTCYRLNNGYSGNITMYSGTPQTMSCTIERLQNTTARVYTLPITIRTYYRYSQFIEQPLQILSTPG